MAKRAMQIRVSTYLDSKGLMAAVDEAKRPVLKREAIKIRDLARKSMHKAPPGSDLSMELPEALKPFVRLGIRAIYQAAYQLGIPAKVVSLALRQSRGRKTAKRRGVPSTAPDPPHVQTGRLKRGVIAEMDPKTGNVNIGPSGEGWYGRIHEFGLGKHPARPFMAPALEKRRKHLPEGFRDMNIGKTKAGRRMNKVRGAKGPNAKTTST